MFFVHHDHESHPYTLRLTECDLKELIAELRARETVAEMHTVRDLIDTWSIFCRDQIAAARRGLTSPEREARGLPLVRTGPGGDYVHDWMPDPSAEVLAPELLDVIA